MEIWYCCYLLKIADLFEEQIEEYGRPISISKIVAILRTEHGKIYIEKITLNKTAMFGKGYLLRIQHA